MVSFKDEQGGLVPALREKATPMQSTTSDARSQDIPQGLKGQRLAYRMTHPVNKLTYTAWHGTTSPNESQSKELSGAENTSGKEHPYGRAVN
jgi:hypothetical protein